MSLIQRKIISFTILLVFLLVLVFVFLVERDETTASSVILADHYPLSEQDMSQEIEYEQKRVPSEDVLPYKSIHGPLPGTLEGTVMQQALVVDEEGNLRISSDIKRVFDFFLSSIEEEDLSVILNRIQEYLDYSLDEPALSQAKEIMNQYIALKKALFDFEVERSESLKAIMEQSGESKGETYLSLLNEQLEAQLNLRSLHLSPETHEAFYADEEAFDSYSLARMQVNADEGLSKEEKQARFAGIDAQAPADIVESRKQAQVTDILKTKTQALKASGASQQEIKALRTEMLGVEAAERFEVLDQERANWNQRIESYLQKRQSILNNDGLSKEAKQQLINDLRENEFDSREQIRLGVYERRADAVK
jgi:lipase chaperone LimK